MNENDDNKRELFKNIPAYTENINPRKYFTSCTCGGKDTVT